ncbi:hypothetical protein OEG92_05610 [Polaribacter sejongensis]|uniref:hypothetical protein n=1 Tax=Polaribacter sejongensis TaxID=985043 RepID=UPI0035A65C53
MKHIAELERGGFIIDGEFAETVGEMISQRDTAVASLAENKAIISGVEVSGTSRTNGIVSLNGKLYSFIGGVAQANVTTKKVAVNRPNASQVDAPAFYIDTLQFGEDGTETFPFDELTRYYSAQPKYKEIKIIGRNITNEELAGTGWFLSNGQNGTDNLQDKFFVVSGNEYSVGDIGGSKQVTLTEAQMPKHKHGMEDGVSTSNGAGYITDGNLNNDANPLDHAFTKETGGDQPHENRPPYYAVVAIQFIGL